MSAKTILLPFNSICAACLGKVASTRYCVERCERNGAGYEVTTAIGHGDLPHLHRVCENCRYEWLERCAAIEPAGVQNEPGVKDAGSSSD